MENRRVLIDTGIVIDYLRKKNKENTKFVELFKAYDLCISVISVFEL
jgi:predicted nucleic acid-binding protein